MKITDIRVIVCAPGRNFVTVKIFTDEGLTGVGDATAQRPREGGRRLPRGARRPLPDRPDAARIEDIWQYLYRGAYWRRGPITMAAIAGIDTALWDIKAKAAGMPLYQLLGGRQPRRGALLHATPRAATIEEAVEAVGAARSTQGYDAIRAQVAIPGLATATAPARSRSTNTADDDAAAARGSLVDAKIPPARPEALRSSSATPTAGTSHLLHDVHHRLTPIEAARLGKDLEPYRLFWLEDAVAAEHQEGFRLIRQHTTTPLAVGEVFNTIWDARTAHRRAADRLHPRHHGACRRRHRAPPHHRLRRRLQRPHRLPRRRWTCRRSASAPTSTSTSGSRTSASRNISGYTDADARGLPVRLVATTDGYLQPGDAPGHGVDIDEDLAAKYPYERAYLPVNRLEDGTMTLVKTMKITAITPLPGLGRHPQPAHRQGRDRRGHLRLGRERPLRPREGGDRRARALSRVPHRPRPDADRRASGRRCTAASISRAAASCRPRSRRIDIALHDIKGKALGVPVYELLGGKQRDRIPTFAIDRERARPEDDRAGAGCWSSAAGTPCASRPPGHEHRTSTSRASTSPSRRKWCVKAREALGDDVVLGIDYHHRLSVAEAASFCQKMPSGTLDFLEEPIRDETPEAYAVAAHG